MVIFGISSNQFDTFVPTFGTFLPVGHIFQITGLLLNGEGKKFKMILYCK